MIYGHKTKFVRAVDGDTVQMLIDHGLGVYSQQILRLARVNAPEMNAGGAVAKQAIEALFNNAEAQKITVETLRKDPYGRWVAEIMLGPANVSNWLLANGHAVPYPKEKP